MAKKKSFEEFREENLKKQEELKVRIAQEQLNQEQAKHRMQRAENQIAYQRKKRDKARVHRLITKGAAIEAICRDTQFLTEAEFYTVMENFLNEPRLHFFEQVADMVSGRAELAEKQEQKLREAEELLRKNAVPEETIPEANVLIPAMPDEEV